MTEFADLALSRRLERAEGTACAKFAEARRSLFPDSGAEWIECAGAYAVFDGKDSPLTQSFGIGLFEELSDASLDLIERFFMDRGVAAVHEVSPLVGVSALQLLCSRKYTPIETSSVLYQPIRRPVDETPGDIRVRVIGAEEAQVWTDINVKGWGHEHPELLPFLAEAGAIFSARQDAVCFLAEIDGVVGAAAALSVNEGVALFAGATTVMEQRRRGLQAALLKERMRYAFQQGCNLAMMAAEVGSNSQRNAERIGFQIAYTRTKWQLSATLSGTTVSSPTVSRKDEPDS